MTKRLQKLGYSSIPPPQFDKSSKALTKKETEPPSVHAAVRDIPKSTGRFPTFPFSSLFDKKNQEVGSKRVESRHNAQVANVLGTVQVPPSKIGETSRVTKKFEPGYPVLLNSGPFNPDPVFRRRLSESSVPAINSK